MADRLKSRSRSKSKTRTRTRTLEDVSSSTSTKTTGSRRCSRSPKRAINSTKSSTRSFKPPKRISRSLSPIRSKSMAGLDWDDDDDDDDDTENDFDGNDDNHHQSWKPSFKYTPPRTTKSDLPKRSVPRGRSKLSGMIGRKTSSLSPKRIRKNKMKLNNETKEKETPKVKSYIFPDLEAETERQERKKGVKDSLFSFLDGVYDSQF